MPQHHREPLLRRMQAVLWKARQGLWACWWRTTADRPVFPHVTYRVEIFNAGEPIAEAWATVPFAPFQVGELLDARSLLGTRWPGLVEVLQRGTILRIHLVRHILWAVGDPRITHDVQLYCHEVPDTDALYMYRPPQAQQPVPWRDDEEEGR